MLPFPTVRSRRGFVVAGAVPNLNYLRQKAQQLAAANSNFIAFLEPT